MNNLEKTRKDLIQLIQEVSDEKLNTRTGEYNWSIVQVLHHLYLTEASITKGVAWALEKDDHSTTESKPLHLILDRSKKIKAPDFLEPTNDFITSQQIQQLLTESRGLLRTTLESIKDESDYATKAFPHPMLGSLNIQQWLEFICMHEKRHTEQVAELKIRR